MDIFKLPNILVIQLKRFIKKDEASGFFWETSTKISDFVDFPTKSLDMRPYVLNESEQTNKDDCLYDLYGVSQHMGSLGGGHYTACCKNPLDNKWYDFNDSSCRKTSESSAVDKNAYLLFYKRRNYSPNCY